MANKRVSTGMRLSETAKRQLEELSDHLGISQTAIVEILIREKAKAEGIAAQRVSSANASDGREAAAI
jgi:hypothetical protein